MKHFICGISLIVVLCGCEGLNNIIVRPVVTEVPGQYVTNITAAFHNGVWQTNYSISPATTTNWVKNELFFGSVDAAGTLVPGWGTLGAAIVGLAGTIYTGWLNGRKKKALVATIKGVEKFRNELKAAGQMPLDDKLVVNLEDAHSKAGVGPMMQEMVDKNTLR